MTEQAAGSPADRHVDERPTSRPNAPLTTQGVWLDPDVESTDLYPGLVVHDGRVTGSITVGQSRLPLWCFIGIVAHDGFDAANDSYDVTENYGFTADDLSGFLYSLLEARGEFGRLLLTLADAERRENDRHDDWAAEQGGGLIEIDLYDRNDPPPWWAYPPERDRVLAQLRRCVLALEREAADGSWPPRLERPLPPVETASGEQS